MRRDQVFSIALSAGFQVLAGRIGELDAVVGEDSVDLVGDGFDQRRRKSAAVRPFGSAWSSTKANLLVRSMATKR